MRIQSYHFLFFILILVFVCNFLYCHLILDILKHFVIIFLCHSYHSSNSSNSILKKTYTYSLFYSFILIIQLIFLLNLNLILECIIILSFILILSVILIFSLILINISLFSLIEFHFILILISIYSNNSLREPIFT